MKPVTTLAALSGLSLFLASAAPPAAAGEGDETDVPGWPLDVGASIWGRFELREGYDRLGVSRGRFLEGDWTVYRARLDLITAPIRYGDSDLFAQVFFSPQVDGFVADQASTVATPNLGVYQGFLRLGRAETFSFDVGRFALNYGDALVIGNLGWHQTARSFDGARVRVSPGEVWIDAFVTQLDEGLRLGFPAADPLEPGGNPSLLEGDAYFAGAYASIGELVGDDTVIEPYVLSQIWLAGDGGSMRPAVQATVGARALQRLGLVDLRFEGGVQLGRRRVAGGANPKVAAYHLDAEVGVTPLPKLRLAVEGLLASGDDPGTATVEGWDQLFPTAHKFLGLMDVIGGRSNIGSVVFHAQYGISDFAAKLDTHVFFRPETAGGQARYAGFESDLNLIYAIMKGMTVRALYGVFVPGDDHYFVTPDEQSPPAPVTNVVHYFELQYGLSF